MALLRRTSLIVFTLVVCLYIIFIYYLSNTEYSEKEDIFAANDDHKRDKKYCLILERRNETAVRAYNLIYQKLKKNCDIRTFKFYSNEELKMTEEMIIDKPNFCGADDGKSMKMIAIVSSDLRHSQQRETIRRSWGMELKSRNVKLLFLLASGGNATIQRIVESEDLLKKDIIQASFHEDYYNLTLKHFAMLHWIVKNCQHVPLLMKADDDVDIDVSELLRHVQKCEKENGFILGYTHHGTSVVRSRGHKLFVPSFLYKSNVWPTYVIGGIYILSQDMISPMLNTALQLNPLYVEDVFFTGIVGEKIGLKYIHLPVTRNFIYWKSRHRYFNVFSAAAFHAQ